jgi:peptidoglycan/LPS O-acetylase OafA/YrhL
MGRTQRTLLLAAGTFAMPLLVRTLGGFSSSDRALFVGYTIVLPALPFLLLAVASWRRRRDGEPRHSTRRIGTVAAVSLVVILLPYVIAQISMIGGGTTPVIAGCLIGVAPVAVPIAATLAWGLTRDLDGGGESSA